MNSRVFLCLSRVCNSISRTVYSTNVMNTHWKSYFINKSSHICTQCSCYGILDIKKEKPKEKVNFSFIRANGEKITVSGEIGKTVMSVAVENHLDVGGACEGVLACTTCHVYIDEKIEEVVPEPTEGEDDMLDKAPFLQPNSRLSCQLIITKEFEGATFNLPLGTVNMHVD